MKNLLSLLGISTALALNFNVSAQVPGSGQAGGFDAQLMKLFGNNAFSAKSDIHVFDKDKKEAATLTMDFMVLDGNVRNEIDFSNVKSKDMPPQAIAQMKAIGMDKIISIMRKDTKMIYVIYPNMKSTAKMPLPKEQADALGKEPKMEKTAMGKDTVDGHACEKNKVVFTDDKGQKKEALVWNATDLKDFPVRIETKEQDTAVQMNFKQVQLAKPDAKLFELPKGYTEYDNMTALQMAAMQKMMEQQK